MVWEVLGIRHRLPLFVLPAVESDVTRRTVAVSLAMAAALFDAMAF